MDRTADDETGEADFAVRDNRERSRFEVEIDGLVAVVDYNRVAGGVVVAHTEVPKALEGRGIAGAMFRTLLAEARRDGLRIIPVCPVFALYLKRHEEVHDLVDPGFRRSLGLPPLPEKG
jgi:predicted GNAT family acetyltransferase